ncbi:caspase family protein, partial [Streptomyces hygroscopicus]|uniref:caspase family protein n=1 Tax=Streptomyces hygroscopicus TaxID=1912 RepID=UPI0036751B72
MVAAVVVDRYAGGGQGRRDRQQLRGTAGSFLEVAARLGFTAAPLRNTGDGVAAGEPGGPAAGTTRAEIEATVRRLRAHPATRKILYWTGHGEKTDDDRYHLACRDSYPGGGGFEPATAVTAAELISWLADDPADILLVLDACFAGAALARTVGGLDALLRTRGGAGGVAGVAPAPADPRGAQGGGGWGKTA